MEILLLLIDMGYSVEIINNPFLITIKLTKGKEIFAYDQNLYMSNPECNSSIIIGGLLVNLYKEMFEKK
jgi:hypothetical protein